MSDRSEDVLDLRSFRQGGEGTPRLPCGLPRAQHRSPQPVLHGGPPELPNVLPCAVAQRLDALAPVCERLRSVDRGSWAPIVRAFTLEDRQRVMRRDLGSRLGPPGAAEGRPGSRG
jgi:hypothetical protein